MKPKLKKSFMQSLSFIVIFTVVYTTAHLLTAHTQTSANSLSTWQLMLVALLSVAINELLFYIVSRRSNARKRKEMNDKYGKLFDKAGI